MRIVIVTTALLLLISCSKKTRVITSVPPPPTTAPAPPVVLGPPAPAPAAVALENATQAFARADYVSAARDYQQYLNLVTAGGKRDDAFFHLGLIYCMPNDPRQDWQRAANYFSQLVNEFPGSPLKPAAQLILTLKSETVQLAGESETRNQRIKQLTTELERLIRIDSERRPK